MVPALSSLTILAYEGPILRAYITALKEAGIRPHRVVIIAPHRDAATGKLVGRWLPRPWRAALAAQTNDLRMNYWPRQLKKTEPALTAAVSRALSPRFSFFDRFMQDLDRPVAWNGWVDERVIAYVDGLKDSALADYLAHSELVLFTGGGLVPGALLERVPGRFLHIHPGHLPDIRGADGLPWSMLVRNRPGRTAFFLTAGLDDGPVLEAEEVEPTRILLPPGYSPDTKTLYRALFAYYDPCLRAELAARILLRGIDQVLQQGIEADGTGGHVFPFMGPILREAALSRIFVRTGDGQARPEP